MSDTLESVKLLDFSFLGAAVAMANGNVHAILQYTAMHTTHGDATRIVAVIERCDKHLRRSLDIFRSRNHLHDFIQEIFNIVGGLLPVGTHPPVLSRSIHHREVELVFGGIEIAHEVKNHLVHLLRTTVRLVYFVHHHDGLQSYLQRLLQHKAGLRHGAFESIHQQQAAVGHVEHTLHLTSEIGVTGRIENVDFGVFPSNGNVFRKNSYPSFALQIIGVQYFAAVILAVTEQFSSKHHLVYQGRFTMVYVRNYCDITNFLH